MKLYLIRHGQSISNADGKISDTMTGLSDLGINQIKDATSRNLVGIGNVVIYHSPMVRTRQTAEIISSFHPGTKIIETDLISEKRDATSLNNRPKSEIPWDLIIFKRCDPDWRHEDGESFNDVKSRIEKFLELVNKLPDNTNIFLISHHSFIKHFLFYLTLGKNFEPSLFYQLYDRIETKNAGISIFERKQKPYESSSSWYLISWMI